MSDELKPCPFCGEAMDYPYIKEPNVARHPKGSNCFAGKAIVHPESAGLWNIREPGAILGPIADLLPDAVLAAEKAMLKYPQPNYVISKWAEETGEVTKALIHAAEGRETWPNLRGEIVQSLAMLHRLMIEGDQVHGLEPLNFLHAKFDFVKRK